ncbi:hypothetical protein AcetOrient_orf01607 [Acetobacter orientalis]|uniref:Uncharacterized protein n=1 Tax=Acetobacter orientalis TaxID=146474 RepID=A0A2Z5ZFL6_9PROT|nr:hypothetical protein AcetOrient_orf01607 [Acetobacter orientalis]
MILCALSTKKHKHKKCFYDARKKKAPLLGPFFIGMPKGVRY